MRYDTRRRSRARGHVGVQVLCKPGSLKPAKKFTAEIYVLTKVQNCAAPKRTAMRCWYAQAQGTDWRVWYCMPRGTESY